METTTTAPAPTPLTTNSPEFIEWLEKCKKVLADHYSTHFPTLARDTLVAEDGGKVIKVISVGNQRSVWAFVAKCDNHTKFLGDVKRGDVLKPATWKAPAKHARGNLFDAQGGMGSIGPYGPAYLK